MKRANGGYVSIQNQQLKQLNIYVDIDVYIRHFSFPSCIQCTEMLLLSLLKPWTHCSFIHPYDSYCCIYYKIKLLGPLHANRLYIFNHKSLFRHSTMARLALLTVRFILKLEKRIYLQHILKINSHNSRP